MRLKHVGLVVAGALLTAAAAADAVEQSMRRIAPRAVAQLFDDPASELKLVRQRLHGDPRRVKPAEIGPLVRERLAEEPLDGSALALMVLAIDPSGRDPRAVRYASLAASMSKRLPMPQLALIYSQVARNDLAGAMDNFDAIMRSAPEALPVFFPYLKRLLASAEVRTILAGKFADRAPWATDFITYAADDPAVVAQIADIVIRTGDRAPEAELRLYGSLLVTRLIEARAYGPLPRLLAALPRGRADMVREIGLTDATTDVSNGLAAWSVVSEPKASATLLTEDGAAGRRALSVYAAPGAQTTVASRIVLLPRGRYQMTFAASTRGHVDPGAQAMWTARCVDDQAPLADGGNILDRTGPRQSLSFDVPRDCPAQKIAMVVRVPFSGYSLDLRIADIALKSGTAPPD